MLLCPDITVKWFFILFSIVELKYSVITGTKSEVCLNKLDLSASLLSETEIVSFQSRHKGNMR